MLDLVAADAAARGSHQEASTALEATPQEDPIATVPGRRLGVRF